MGRPIETPCAGYRSVIQSCYRWVAKGGGGDGALPQRSARRRVRPLRGLPRAGGSGRPGRRHRPRHPARPAPRAGPPGHRPARRGLRRRRPAPAGVRPRDAHRDRSRVGEAGLPPAVGRRVVAAGPAARAGRARRPVDGAVGRGRADPRRQSRGVPLPRRPAVRLDRAPPRHAGAAPLGRADDRARVGRDDGAHRAGRRVGRRRGPHPGRRAARRHLAPRRGEAVHHRGRARPRREHRAPRAGPPGGPGRHGAARHEGPVAVPRAEVPLRLRDRASSASATACSPRTSSTRWGSRRPRPAS